MARVGWTEDLASDAKARRIAEAKPSLLTSASPIAKAQKNETMPWATTHDEGQDNPGGSANIQGEQVPLRLSATAKALAESLRKSSKATTTKDDDGDAGSVEMADKAEWSAAEVNKLPDSAFLHIEDGGEKDEEGKTTPRSLRHFPVKGPDGKPDEVHVRNALGRIPQSDLPAKVKAEASGAARKMLDDLNDEETHKAQWPSDLNSSRKTASGKVMPGTLQAAVAKDLEAAWKAGDDASLGQAARDKTKEPAETERGKMYDGANPVRTTT